MSTVFIVTNQHNHYLGKHDDWVDGSEPAQLFRSPHRDVVLNKLIDANIKDFTLRAEIMSCDIDKNKLPIVEVLNPLPKEPKQEPELEFSEDEQKSKEIVLAEGELETVAEAVMDTEETAVIPQTDA